MDDLVQWLRAQLDVDEQVARDAAHYEAGNWTTENGYPVSVADELPDTADMFERVVAFDEGSPSAEQARHIATWDPARVLREIDAKRRILDECTYWHDKLAREAVDPSPVPFPALGEVLDAVTPILRALALPYADRPGYRDDWRP